MTLTQEQLQIRCEGIGASEAPAMMGVCPWQTPAQLLRKKRKGWIEKKPQGMRPNEQMDIGNALENSIAQLAAKRMGWDLQASGTVRDPVHPWRMATPDRLITARGGVEQPGALLEVKNVGWRALERWMDGPPIYYWCQVQWQMLVTGIHEAYIAALMGGRNLAIYEVPYASSAQSLLAYHGGLFWRAVTAGGEVDGTSEAGAALCSIYEAVPCKLLPRVPYVLV